MSDYYVVESQSLSDVADAIREKTGGTADLEFPDEFVSEIGSITVGDTSAEDGILDGTIDLEYSNPRITSIRAYAFRECKKLISADLPNVTSLSASTFQECERLRTVNIPSVTSILNGGNFYNCRNLLEVSLKNLSGNLATEIFRGTRALLRVDLGNAAQLGAGCFTDTNFLNDIILRKSDGVCAMANVNVLPITEVRHVYVPKDLISSYQAASNWSTKYAEQPTLFRGLEDYTVDGTISGDFDNTKAHPEYTPVYTAENLEFNGTSDYVDTEVNLYDSDGVFTVIMHFSTTGDFGNPGNRNILCCFDETQQVGFKMHNNGNATTSFYQIFRPNVDSTGGDLMNPGNAMGRDFYVVFRSTGLVCTSFLMTPDKVFTNYNQRKVRTGTIDTTSETLVLGARRLNGTYDSFWKGTIHFIKVYKAALTTYQIYRELGLIS